MKRRTAAQIVEDASARGVSQAKKTFAGVAILTERPADMSYEDYIRYRKEQQRALKHTLHK